MGQYHTLHVYMLAGRWLQWLLGVLDVLESRFLSLESAAEHLRVGLKGEEEAYFELRRKGYIMVARNFRSPRCHGEIDLIGWDGDVLCFIEVKTRTSKDVKTAEAAVDRHKRREIAEMAREYLRKTPPLCQWRFDIVSVYYDGRNSRPSIEVFRNASLAA
jgi:putative endonuclease